MIFDLFLSPIDATRIRRVLEGLALRDFRDLALTGSLALEAHLIRLGYTRRERVLNDVDIVVASFDSIPDALAKDFLVRHIHPKAPEGKILIQLVDPHEALRIDVFRAYGATIARSQSVGFEANSLRLVSLEDLAARAASLVMDLERGATVPRKHTQDFHVLAEVVNFDLIEAAWRDHRKPTDPPTFKEAVARIRDLVDSRGELFVTPKYSHDVDAVCPKCEGAGSFRPASPIRIMSILGYC